MRIGDLVRYKLEQDFVGVIGGFDFTREGYLENQESVHVYWQKTVSEPHLGVISEWFMCPADLEVYKKGNWRGIRESEILDARMREELKRT